jgi:hypothetical protein
MNPLPGAQKLIEARGKMLRRHWRKIITGDEKRRIRDMIKDKRAEPVYIKFIDKLAYTLGVLNISISQHFIFAEPNSFWIWYSIILVLLLTVRIHQYQSKGLGYFLIDFCYLVNLSTFIHMYIIPSDAAFFKAIFICAFGPLMWAIPIWGNSLVFHDFEKITSIYIHIMPASLMYTIRFYGNMREHTTLTFLDFVGASALYLAWQIAYFMKTEVIDVKKLDANPQMQTSLRWLTTDKKNTMTKLTLKFCKKIRLFKSDEDFDPKSFKTKMVFMTCQLVYTFITFATVLLFYQHRNAAAVFIVFIFTISVYQGGSYYIEIFSNRYQLKFNRQDTKQFAKAAAEVAIEVVRMRRSSELELNGLDRRNSDGSMAASDSRGRSSSKPPVPKSLSPLSDQISKLQSQLNTMDPEDDRYEYEMGILEDLQAQENYWIQENQSQTKIDNGIGMDMSVSQSSLNEPEVDQGAELRNGATNETGTANKVESDWNEDDERELIAAATEAFVDEYLCEEDADTSERRSRASSENDNDNEEVKRATEDHYENKESMEAEISDDSKNLGEEGNEDAIQTIEPRDRPKPKPQSNVHKIAPL